MYAQNPHAVRTLWPSWLDMTSGRQRSVLAQIFEQIGFGVFFLRAVRQRLQRPQAFRYFIVAENQGIPGAEFIRLSESFPEFLFHRRQLNAEARLAQIFRRADSGGVSSL